jgi:hypothetical protein
VSGHILFVDDEPDLLLPLAGLISDGAQSVVKHPDDVADVDLEDADLIIVDYLLDDWLTGLSTRATFVPGNGIGLAAAYRSRLPTENRRPTGFAIHTGLVADLGRELPKDIREHAIARALNLEWVFPKAPQPPSVLASRIKSLADALDVLPDAWSDGESEGHARQLLGLGDEPWSENAWLDIQDAHAPLHELAAGSNGMAFLRWLLHRIIPYPCFLLDANQLAARLRIHPGSLGAAFANHTGGFASAQYGGILAGFEGQRWWRAGIESVLFAKTSGASDDTGAVLAIAREEFGDTLDSFGEPNPVLTIDEDFSVDGSLHPITECVRLQPDDWPSYADQAWALRVDVRNSGRLRTLTVAEDRALL